MTWLRSLSPAAVFRAGAMGFSVAALGAWVTAGKDLAAAPVPGSLPVFLAIFVAMLLWGLRGRALPVTQRRVTGVAFGILTAWALVENFTWPFFAGCCLVGLLLGLYARKGANLTPLPAASTLRGRPWQIALVWILGLGFFALVSLWTVGRVRSLSAPTYDFGIFAQMFHNMRTTGAPVTTLEREATLSHFRVHMSPIYYLMLPFYALVPRPETLQVLQAAVMASALWPLWKLCAALGLKPGLRLAVCCLLVLQPAYAGGAAYDLHENCFLTPLLLWLFYGIQTRQGWMTALMGLLTLAVKEDAAVYVAVAGLWCGLTGLLHKDAWKKRWGLALAAGALVWFLGVTWFLARHGDGVMANRYRNFFPEGQENLGAVVRTMVLLPLKALYECLDLEKLPYLALTLGPVALLPLFTGRWERLVLLIPWGLVNLMPDYVYQHDIFFQYNFGSQAFLIALTAMNLGEVPWKKLRGGLAGLALGAAAVTFVLQTGPEIRKDLGRWERTGARCLEIRQVLAEIDREAPVAATTFLTVPLSNRSVVYDVRYCSREQLLSCEYAALDPADRSAAEVSALLSHRGWQVVAEIPGELVVYEK